MAYPVTIGGVQIPVYTIDTTRGGLGREARSKQAQFEKQLRKGGFIDRANQQSLKWIQDKALQNLKSSIAGHGRPAIRSRKTNLLEKAILSPKYSTADEHGLEFLIRSKIFPDVPYYASVEYGDRSQIGRQILFTILGTTPNVPGGGYVGGRNPASTLKRGGGGARAFRHPKRPNAGRAIGQAPDFLSDRIIGPRERNRRKLKGTFRAVIQRPVPEYAYGRRAGDSFLSTKQYRRILDETSAAFQQETGVSLDA